MFALSIFADLIVALVVSSLVVTTLSTFRFDGITDALELLPIITTLPYLTYILLYIYFSIIVIVSVSYFRSIFLAMFVYVLFSFQLLPYTQS